ncbi:MAG: DUF1045 domain-containing protein [Rhodobacteraceae bacterium]|nr:DUF1045 domain-containing protein [Paracoccaceae bacterium]
MEGYARYAIYAAAPQGSPLGDFTAAWLGWDPEAGQACARAAAPGLPAPIGEITASPSRYGFHGTLKAPFRLADNVAAADLDAELTAFAGETAAPVGPPLRLDVEMGFVSLRPSGPTPALDALAGEIVRRFDRFRAPLSEAELIKRRASGLTPAQDANLTQWGYPHVLDQFHYHMTLSSQLPSDVAEAVRAELAPRLEPLLEEAYILRELCLFGDPGAAGHFRLLRRYPLQG